MCPIFPSQPAQTFGPRTKRWWIGVWSPAIVAVVVICIESTQTFGAENTSGWLRPVFEKVFGHFQDGNWDVLHHYIRKTGHFLGYGTMGLTFLHAWLWTFGNRGWNMLRSWRVRSILFAIVSTALIASCDEWHQTFLPDRTGTPVDVLLDTCGATALCLMVWLVRFRAGNDTTLPSAVDA